MPALIAQKPPKVDKSIAVTYRDNLLLGMVFFES